MGKSGGVPTPGRALFSTFFRGRFELRTVPGTTLREGGSGPSGRGFRTRPGGSWGGVPGVSRGVNFRPRIDLDPGRKFRLQDEVPDLIPGGQEPSRTGSGMGPGGGIGDPGSGFPGWLSRDPRSWDPGFRDPRNRVPGRSREADNYLVREGFREGPGRGSGRVRDGLDRPSYPLMGYPPWPGIPRFEIGRKHRN